MNPRIIRFAVCALKPLGYSKVVLAEGLEPPCDQLPFLDCIRVRGYASMLGCLMGVEPTLLGATIQGSDQLSYRHSSDEWTRTTSYCLMRAAFYH